MTGKTEFASLGPPEIHLQLNDVHRAESIMLDTCYALAPHILTRVASSEKSIFGPYSCPTREADSIFSDNLRTLRTQISILSSSAISCSESGSQHLIKFARNLGDRRLRWSNRCSRDGNTRIQLRQEFDASAYPLASNL